MNPLALICSVQLEIEPLFESLQAIERIEVGRRHAYTGVLSGANVIVVVAGIGKVNAARCQRATKLTQQERQQVCQWRDLIGG